MTGDFFDQSVFQQDVELSESKWIADPARTGSRKWMMVGSVAATTVLVFAMATTSSSEPATEVPSTAGSSLRIVPRVVATEPLARAKPAAVNWFDEATRRLTEIQTLGLNWDSYGGSPVTSHALAAARKYLLRLARDTPRAFVVPTSQGGVAFDWKTSDGELEVEFTPNGGVQIDNNEGSALPAGTPLDSAAQLAHSLSQKTTA